MTDAPEKIWAWVDSLAGVVGQLEEPETPRDVWPGPNAATLCAPYIREDVARAMVAAAFSRAAEKAMSVENKVPARNHHFNGRTDAALAVEDRIEELEAANAKLKRLNPDLTGYANGYADAMEDAPDPVFSGEDAKVIHAMQKRHIEKLEAALAAKDAEAQAMVAAALEPALVGGNHLVAHLPHDYPPPSADPLEALEQIGAGITYDIWCAWAGIMNARDNDARAALEASETAAWDAAIETVASRFRAFENAAAYRSMILAMRKGESE